MVSELDDATSKQLLDGADSHDCATSARVIPKAGAAEVLSRAPGEAPVSVGASFDREVLLGEAAALTALREVPAFGVRLLPGVPDRLRVAERPRGRG